MMIKLTFTTNKKEFWMRAQDVLSIERAPDNPLATRVATIIMTPKGPTVFEVLESPDDIAKMVMRALGKKDLIDN